MLRGDGQADKLICRSPDEVSVDVAEDSMVVLKVADGAYYELDRTARRIWMLLAKPICVTRLCDAVVGEYDVERDRCETDIAAFLEQLSTAGLIVSSATSSSAAEL